MSDRITRAFKILARSRLRETDTLRVRAILMHDLALRAARYEKGRFNFNLRPCVCALKPWGLVAVVAALAIMIGGGAAVAVAQVAIPGHALYGVKLASERVAIALTGDEALGLQVQSTLASRRAEELVLLRVRAAAQSATVQQQTIAREMAATVKRLNRSLDKIQRNVVQVKAQADTATRLQSVEQNVQMVKQALRHVKGSNALDPEIAEAVREARETVREIEANVREDLGAAEGVPQPAVSPDFSGRPLATQKTVENVFAEIDEIARRIGELSASLKARGISLTVGIDQDIKVSQLLRNEAAEYLSMNRYEEAQGLAQTAARMGGKVVKMLEERLGN